jgi:DNA-binding XRE family transcriptional regulator
MHAELSGGPSTIKAAVTLEVACREKAVVVDEITIGARLPTLRRWRRMTQAELAELAGLSPSFLSMVETGPAIDEAELNREIQSSAKWTSERNHSASVRSAAQSITRSWAERAVGSLFRLCGPA